MAISANFVFWGAHLRNTINAKCNLLPIQLLFNGWYIHKAIKEVILSLHSFPKRDSLTVKTAFVD